MRNVPIVYRALVGGVIWNMFGFQYVFLLGMVIAIINFFTALRVRLPELDKHRKING